jgi:hypothetical protein
VAKKVFELKPNEAEFNFGTEPKDASLEDIFSSQVKPSRVGEHALIVYLGLLHKRTSSKGTLKCFIDMK